MITDATEVLLTAWEREADGYREQLRTFAARVAHSRPSGSTQADSERHLHTLRREAQDILRDTK